MENCEAILSVPGIGFAEMGPGDMSMSMGIIREAGSGGELDQDERIIEARRRVNSACKENGIVFIGGGSAENIEKTIDSGARIISGRDQEVAKIGRQYSQRQMD